MEWQILVWGRLVDAAAGVLIVLTVGSLAARLCRQPARRPACRPDAPRRDGRPLPKDTEYINCRIWPFWHAVWWVI